MSVLVWILYYHSVTQFNREQELHPEFAAFPTYPVILPFKHTDQEVIDFYARSNSTPIKGVPKFDTKGVLDGERKLQFFKPLPVTSEGRKFEIRSKVLGVYDKGKPGTVVETEQCLVDVESGETYTRAVGSGFYVGQGNWGGPKGELCAQEGTTRLLYTNIPVIRSQGTKFSAAIRSRA